MMTSEQALEEGGMRRMNILNSRWRKPVLAVIWTIVGLLLAGILMLTWCADSLVASEYRVENGYLDLSRWTPDGRDVIKLDGDWEFYWNEFVAPGTVKASSTYYEMPRHWSGTLNGEQLIAYGAATYRMHIRVRPGSETYGLRLANIRMASSVYVNGELVGASGTPALARADYAYENKPYTVFFPVSGESIEIVIYAANYDFLQGGVPHSIYFGDAEAINRLDRTSAARSLMVVVSLVMLGVYHLCVYAVRRSERGLLYFGLYCITLGAAFFSNGDRSFMLFFELPPVQFYRLLSISMLLSLLFMALFLKHTCAGLIPEWLTKITYAVVPLYLLVIMVTPFRIYSTLNYLAGILQTVFYLTILGYLSYAYHKQHYGTFSRFSLVLFIGGTVCLVIGLVDFSLYQVGADSNYVIGYFGIFIFNIIISILLAFRFHEAHRTIEQMAHQLQASNQLKDEFLIQTSHEFQTPLNGIINLTQALMDGSSGQVNAQQKNDLTIVKNTARKLSLLVNDILDIEKMRRNELRIQMAAIDVKAVVSTVLELFRYISAGKNIRFRDEVPHDLPLVHADENRLSQVMYNLIGNAVKFTHDGSVTITAARQGDDVKICIEDTGIGISPHIWEIIFDSYERAGSSDGEYMGQGLGLYISRQLVQLMGGAIGVEWSEPDKGTRFAFTLKVAPAEAEEFVHDAMSPSASGFENPEQAILIPSPVSGDASSERQTLLAVDDEPSNLQVLSSLFKDRYNILFASSGKDALQILQDCPVDLVLLDVMMSGGMNGYEVCRQIRKLYTLVELPVVMMTVRHTSQDISIGFEAGANDFIIKPYDAHEVMARVDTLLALGQSVKDMIRVEMDFLRSQIKPHFLFNALNAILSFCRTDPERTEHLISQLSYYMRQSFDRSGDIFVPLMEELQLVNAYVEIEKARFEERLCYRIEVDDSLLYRTILPLTIQPLVENAIRHGVTKKEDGGNVQVKIKLDEDGLLIEVTDDGVGMTEEVRSSLLENGASAYQTRRGVGIMNIHRRLLYYTGQGLTIVSAEGLGTKVSFRS
jgi:signal transduction histidine kinase